MCGRLGLIINPIAGIGGRVGLKGSDGAAVQARAAALGGASIAQERSIVALRPLRDCAIPILTASGLLGEAACRAAGVDAEVVADCGHPSSAADTRHAVEAFRGRGVDLILFAGGDGTARDVADAAGDVPILGIPAGVKMYSGVFATSPMTAGQVAASYLGLREPTHRTRVAELLDTDEDALRSGSLLRVFGVARTPLADRGMQRAKAVVPADDDGQVAALCRDLAARLEPDCLSIVGPGTTTRSLLQACGVPKTLLGVDLLLGRDVLVSDASEAQILEQLNRHPARIVVGLLGGQGCLFGRGNPQISSRVLARVGRDRITVLAGAAKLASLPHGLFVDTGDPAVDAALSGHIRVETAPGRTAVLRVRSGDMSSVPAR